MLSYRFGSSLRRRVALSTATILGGFMGQAAVRADYPNKVLDSAPIGFWRLNDAVTAERLLVNSGTAGVSLDATYQNGEPGTAGASEMPDGTLLPGMGFRNKGFDIGTNQSYIGVEQSPLSSLQAFTLSGWFRPRSISPQGGGLMGQRGAVELGMLSDAEIILRTANGGSLTWSFDPSTEFVSDGWNHLAAVGTGTELRLYLNGTEVASQTAAAGASYGNSNSPFRIGSGILAAAGDQFSGTVDDIAIWNRALTGEAIAEQFTEAFGANRLGDFNGNDRFDIEDANLLSLAIFEGSDDVTFDVTENGSIDEDDLTYWVRDVALTYFGDADLDGEFSSRDFVFVFQKGEYEDKLALNSGWNDGDWNADREFTSADFVMAFQDGGFEKGPVTAFGVPEPHGVGLLTAACAMLAVWRRSFGSSFAAPSAKRLL